MTDSLTARPMLRCVSAESVSDAGSEDAPRQGPIVTSRRVFLLARPRPAERTDGRFQFLTDRCYHAACSRPSHTTAGTPTSASPSTPSPSRLGLNLDALLPAEYRHARRQHGPPGLTIADGRPPSALAPCQGRGGVNDLRNGTADDELLRRGSGMAPKPGLRADLLAGQAPTP